MKKNIILVGDFPETIELCELCDYNILGLISPTDKKKISGYTVLGDDCDASKICHEYKGVSIVISPDKPTVRKRLFNLYKGFNAEFESVISPKAYISPSAQIGKGCIIQSFCNISTNVNIGNFVKINTYANIMHDCKIDDYATIAPNAVVLGAVQISESSYVGANSTILQTKKIGRNSVIGAGAVVTKDVLENVTVVGVPATPLDIRKGD